MEQDVEVRDPQAYAVIGAAMEVHSVLGHGFLENVYQEAMECELKERGIPYEREFQLPIQYKKTQVACAYRADFVCFDTVVVELKALRVMSGTEKKQILNYLKASGYRRGLVLNFGADRLQYDRYAL